MAVSTMNILQLVFCLECALPVYGAIVFYADNNKTAIETGQPFNLNCENDASTDVKLYDNNLLGFCIPDFGGSCTLSKFNHSVVLNLPTGPNKFIFKVNNFQDSYCGKYTCADGNDPTKNQTVPIGSKAKLSGKIKDLNDGSLELETDCFDPADALSVNVLWECKTTEGPWKAIDSKSEALFVPSDTACTTNACRLVPYKKQKKVAKFEHCPTCKTTLRAMLSYELSSYQPVPSEEILNAPILGPIPSTAEPTTTITTSTTTTTTTTSATTDVQTTASTPTTATSTVTLPTTSAPTTATSTVTAPTTATSIVTAPTTSTPTTAISTVTAPTTATSTIIAPTTSAPTTATQTVTAPTTSPIISSNSSTTSQVGYIIGGCIAGAIVVALLIVIPLCLLRGPMCKGWRSKKSYETSKDPGAKHSSIRHHRHGGNSHTRKQYGRPQKSHTPDRSFRNQYNNHAYVGPAGRSSGHHVNVLKPPSYSFYDPYSGEYVRTAGQRGGHPIGQRYAPYPQSQQRGRMKQTWYEPYTPGRPGFFNNSGNRDFYYLYT